VQVVEAKVRVLGEDHAHKLTCINSLAFTWKEQGGDKEPVRRMGECAQLRTKVLVLIILLHSPQKKH
jgi:hypothetical protein